MSLEFVLSGFADELRDQKVERARWDKSEGGVEDRYSVFQQDLEYQIKCFKEMDIRFIELRQVGGVGIGEMNNQEKEYIANRFKETGMQISALGTGDGKVNISDDMAAHYAKFQGLVDTANWFKSQGVFDDPALRIFSYYNKGDKKYTKDAWGQSAVAELRKRAQYASQKGVKLWLENEFLLYGDTAIDSVQIA